MPAPPSLAHSSSPSPPTTHLHGSPVLSLNLDRIMDPEVRAQTLVFAPTGLAEQSFVALTAASAEITESSHDDVLVDRDAPEFRELYELLINLETFAQPTRMNLADLTIHT